MPQRRQTATAVLVLLILGGSAASFAISEGLKVQRAAITAVHVGKVFSPVCQCPTDRVAIEFTLTRSDRMSIAIVDAKGRSVRTLVAGKLFGRGRQRFTWNGRNDAGTVVADGAYEPRVHLVRTARTYLMPNPMVVDTTPPRVRVVSVTPRTIEPGADGGAGGVRVEYIIDEHAHALLYVDGKLRVRTRFERPRDSLAWFGAVGSRALPPGRYRLSLAAIDLGGNRSRPVPAGSVLIRYVELPSSPIRSRPMSTIVIRVSTMARKIRYVLRQRHRIVSAGTSPRTLSLHAPTRPGTYTLEVVVAGHRAHVALIVSKR
jgi:FlgD Ig-like domain